MQNLLISSGKSGEPAYLKHYLRSFPSHFPDVVENFLKDKKINLRGISLAQLHAFIVKTWQEHCLEKRVSRDFKRHQSMYSHSFCKDVAKIANWVCGAYNRGYLGKESCHCNKKKKGFHTSTPRYHPDKSYKHKTHKSYMKKSRNPFYKKAYVRKRSEPADKEKCFICGKKGHWESKCPQKKSKPKLAPFFEQVDPAWWALYFCEQDQYPSGEIMFLPNDSDIHLNKFAPSDSDSSSSDSDSTSESNLGGCEGPPDFDFSCYMFSSSTKPSPQQRLAAIDQQLSKILVFEYILRGELKEEKKKLLSLLKGKEKQSEEGKLSPSHHPTFYNPAEHEDRQKFRKDKENLLCLQIKEKQNFLKKLVREIEDLKRVLEVTVREKDQSSEDEMCRQYHIALKSPKHEKKDSKEDALLPEPSLGLFTGPKMCIQVSFCPQ